jgi:hypothetical protein
MIYVVVRMRICDRKEEKDSLRLQYIRNKTEKLTTNWLLKLNENSFAIEYMVKIYLSLVTFAA